MRRVEERKLKKLELMNRGYKPHELVKDSHGFWRAKIERAAKSSPAAIQKHRIKNNIICRFKGHDRPLVQVSRGKMVKSPICIRCGKVFKRGWVK